MINLSFLHIPKTAGTSIINLLKEKYGTGGILAKDLEQRCFGLFNDWKSMKSEIIERIIFNCDIDALATKSFQLALGHFSLDTLLRLKSNLIITVFREPRIRIISEYYYLKSWSLHDLSYYGSYGYLKKPSDWSLCQFLGNHQYTALIDNLQSRMLLPFRLCPPDKPLDRANFTEYKKVLKERVRHIHAIGFVESINNFQETLSALLGTELNFPHLNKTNYNKEDIKIDNEIMDRFEKRTWLDSWLYDYAAKSTDQALTLKSRDASFLSGLRRYGVKEI